MCNATYIPNEMTADTYSIDCDLGSRELMQDLCNCPVHTLVFYGLRLLIYIVISLLSIVIKIHVSLFLINFASTLSLLDSPLLYHNIFRYFEKCYVHTYWYNDIFVDI